MSAWSHLPNAAHIDRVIESLNAYPEVWGVARDAAWDAVRKAAWDAAWDAAGDAAWDAVRDAAWGVARDATWGVARDAAWDAAGDAARRAAWDAAWDAVMALIAYEDAAKYLAMPSDELKACAVLSKNPAAILLIPAVIAYERISKLELSHERTN